jgi:hypothetical protein
MTKIQEQKLCHGFAIEAVGMALNGFDRFDCSADNDKKRSLLSRARAISEDLGSKIFAGQVDLSLSFLDA